MEGDFLVYNSNRFQACRFGLDGVIVNPRSYEPRSLRDDIEATLQMILPILREFGSDPVVYGVERLLSRGNDASLLRSLHSDQGSFDGVAAQSVRRFRAG